MIGRAAPFLGGPGPRVRQGDNLIVSVASAVPTLVDARADILGDDGIMYRLGVPGTRLVGDRLTTSILSSEKSPREGVIVRAYVGFPGAPTPNQGQTYANLQLNSGGLVAELCRGYLGPLHALSLGYFGEPGPSLEGHRAWRTVADDITPVDVVDVLARTNAFKRVYGFAWYYHAGGDAGDRTLRVSVRAPGLSLPTGFSISEGIGFTHSSVVTLSVNEEGIVYCMGGRKGPGFSSRNDNGAIVSEATSTVPNPFPLDVEESDLVEIFFDVTDPFAADRHSIFVLEEEWVLG